MTSIEPATRRRGVGVPGQLVTGVAVTRRWLARYVLAAAAAAAFLVFAILHHGFPEGVKGVLAVTGIIAVLAPPLVLFAFWVALGELARLPDRLQQLPLDAREHGEELRGLFDRARAARGSRFQLARVVWQLTRTTNAARETLTPYGPLLPLVNVPFLLSTAIAALAASLEIAAALIVALVLAAG